MAFGFKPRGLFGRKPQMPGVISGYGGGTFNMDGTQATPVQRDEPEWLQTGATAQAAPKRGGLFGKITGAMGDIGSVLDDSPEGMQERRWRMEQEAAQQEAAAAAAAEQRKRVTGLEDYEARKRIDQRYGGGDDYTYFEDNAGNRWRQHKQTGAVDPNPAFIDRTPKEFVHEGMRFSIPNPWAAQTAPQGNLPRVTDEASYNAIPPGAQYYDDKGNLRTKSGGPSQPATGGFPGY